MKTLYFYLFLVCSIPLFGVDLSLKRHQFYVGPEYVHVTRKKQGGVQQKGDLFGIKFGYDRLKRYGWYWGADASYLKGVISGNGEDFTLRSCFTDTNMEGRFGYTFQYKKHTKVSFTPFIGGGYISEANNFINPSPLPIHFENRYGYATTGFLTWFHAFTCFEIGLNFKVRWPFDPQCRVSNDPDNEPINQNISPKLQYKIELPITYRITCDSRCSLVLNPFYESRNYGYQVNFPFDFIDTRVNLYGLTLSFQYRFW